MVTNKQGKPPPQLPHDLVPPSTPKQRTGTTTPCGKSSSGNLRMSCSGAALLPMARMGVSCTPAGRAALHETPAESSTSATLQCSESGWGAQAGARAASQQHIARCGSHISLRFAYDDEHRLKSMCNATRVATQHLWQTPSVPATCMRSSGSKEPPQFSVGIHEASGNVNAPAACVPFTKRNDVSGRGYG